MFQNLQKVNSKKNCVSKVRFLDFIQKYDKSADSSENVNENDSLVLVKTCF